MAVTGRLRSGAGTGESQDLIIQDSQKLDAVLAAVERIGDSLEHARMSLEAKIDKVASNLVLLHADHRKLADKTSEVEAKVNELTPVTAQLKTGMEDIQARVMELELRVEDAEGHSRRNNIRAGTSSQAQSNPGRRNEAHTGPTKCTPDLEQLIQERREAIHTAGGISASPLVSGSDTELSQPASDRPLTPDRLSELGLVGGPPVTPANADELF
ncbi:hypothetical protein NDU88_007628 [Pleurodeles waltl]|uniref:Uncharacterized protein n=1 Tax=Pleurodeles waltl TaxID=8319 RepID=A0AAV7QQC2_PLEWA|nr:hypothetical protein NDU88_007628 [Pleurodeles waltl]